MAYLLCTINCLLCHTALTHPVSSLGKFNTNWATKQHQCLDFFNSRQLVQVNHWIVALLLYFSALLKWTLESKKSFIPLSTGIGFPHQCRTRDVLWKHHICLAPSSTLGTLRLSGQEKLLQDRCLREVRAPQISSFLLQEPKKALLANCTWTWLCQAKLLVKKNSTILQGACLSNADKKSGSNFADFT